MNVAKTALLARKTELEREGRTAAEFDHRIRAITEILDGTDSSMTSFDEITVRQLVSSIKVLDKERLLIRFKDGTETEQIIESVGRPCV